MKINQKKVIKEIIARGIDSGSSKSSFGISKEIKTSILDSIMKEIDEYFLFDEIESMRDKFPANVAGNPEFYKFSETNRNGHDGC